MADFTIKKGDLLPELEATLKDGAGTAIDLTARGGGTVRFHMRLRDSGEPTDDPSPSRAETIKVDAPATVVTAASGEVKYSWVAGDTDTAGDYFGEFEITWATGSLPQRIPSDGHLEILVMENIA